MLFIAHPHQVFWLDNQLLFRGHRLLYGAISKNSAYAIQDLSCLSAIERSTNISFKRHYLPPPVTNHYGNNLPKTRDLIDENCVNILWLGRLDYDKITSLINLLDNLMEVPCKRTIVHIIGGGNSISLININKYAPKITIIFNSIMFGEERNNYIRNNADIALAMGVSSLDTSIEGVPTILPIVSRTMFKDDRYTLIYDSPEYSLGFTREDCISNKVKTYSLREIIDMVFVQKKKIEIGKRCQNYVLSEFSVQNNIDTILETICGTKMTRNMICHNPVVLQQMVIYSLYRFFRKNNCEYNDYVTYLTKIKQIFDHNKIESFKTIIHDLLLRGKR